MQLSTTLRFTRLRAVLLSVPAALTVLVLGACSGGGSDSSVGQMGIDGPPTNNPVGLDFPVTVNLLTSGGVLDTSSTATVTAALGANSAGGTLSGTTSVQAVGGVATFNQLRIDTPGSGYTLVFSAPGFVDGVSLAFNIVGPPAGLAFMTQPGSATSFQELATPVDVHVVDALGNTVPDAVMDVTIAFENNPGELILHASGMGDPDTAGDERLFELVDPAIPAVLHWLPGNTGLGEALELVQNPDTGELHVFTQPDENFYTGDAATGFVQLVGDGTVDDVKGAAFESGAMARLLAVVKASSALSEDDLYEVDPTDGTMSSIGTLTPDMGVLDGFTGLAHDSSDDTFFGAVNLTGVGFTGRALVQIFPGTLTTTVVGDMADLVGGLAIGGDGTIYAVTGEGGGAPETLFTVDETTGAMTMLLPLGAGDNGEAIATVAAQLRGTTTVQTVGGIASFAGLQVNAVGSGYTLRADTAGLTSATSAPFDVTAPTPGGTVMFAAASQMASETDGTVTIELVVDAAQAHDIVVTMSVGGSASGALDGSPDHDVDTTFFFQVTIPQGQTSGTGTIAVVDDTDAEGDETIELFIEDASLAAAIGVIDTHTVTLSSDE